MTRSKRFEPIREIVSSCADALGPPMADAARKVAELERQLVQLETYRDEYLRGSAGDGGAMDAVRLQNYRSFLDRLGEALRQHTKNLETARTDYELRRTRWSEKRVEAETLGRAIDRFRAEERRAADGADQRELDEAAMRMALASQAERSEH